MSAPPSYELPKNMYGVSFNRESAYKHIPIVNADIANKSLFLFIFIAPEIYNSLALLFFFRLLNSPTNDPFLDIRFIISDVFHVKHHSSLLVKNLSTF